MIASFLNYIFGYNKQNDPCNTNINTNKIDKVFTKLPYELKDYIFSYDGRIKYKYKMNPLVVTWPPIMYTDYGLKGFPSRFPPSGELQVQP